MNRALASTLILFTTALAVLAAPARPLYEPPPPEKLPQVQIDLRGTTWIAVDGMDFNLNRYLVFLPDGQLRYSNSQDVAIINRMTGQNATWKLDGTTLYFEIN